MTLFQCEICGCVDNTATSTKSHILPGPWDWTDREHLKGKAMCCVCGPTRYRSGDKLPKKTLGRWHNKFDRVFLPMGMFTTNEVGNLAHKITGDEDYRKYATRVVPAVKGENTNEQTITRSA